MAMASTAMLSYQKVYPIHIPLKHYKTPLKHYNPRYYQTSTRTNRCSFSQLSTPLAAQTASRKAKVADRTAGLEGAVGPGQLKTLQ